MKQPDDDLPEDLLGLRAAVEVQGLDPTAALTRVLAFLRVEPKHSAALRLYHELSAREYEARRSCLSHSHLPPKG